MAMIEESQGTKQMAKGEIAMTQTTKTRLNFEEFLEYDDGTENRYELEDGELELMPDPSFEHEDIGEFLADEFKAECRRLKLSYLVRRFMSLKIAAKTGKKPDVVVFPASYLDNVDRRKSAFLSKTPPLVVEIVSGGNWKNDYVRKKLYYINIAVPEYWVLDPIPKGTKDFLELPGVPTVSVGWLEGGQYKVKQCRGDDEIPCKLFPELKLTVNQLFAAGR